MNNMKNHYPRIYCKDGVSLSVQASKFNYSIPRADTGPYSKAEVGFIEDEWGKPMSPPEDWRDHADGDFPSSVYGYVPMSKIEEFIASHGGIDIGRSL